jgi:hypothetical protein
MNYANTHGYSGLLLGNGTFLISAGLPITCTVQGSGMGYTAITFPGGLQYNQALSVSKPGLTLSQFSLICSGPASADSHGVPLPSTAGILVQGQNGTTISSVNFIGISGDGSSAIALMVNPSTKAPTTNTVINGCSFSGYFNTYITLDGVNGAWIQNCTASSGQGALLYACVFDGYFIRSDATVANYNVSILNDNWSSSYNTAWCIALGNLNNNGVTISGNVTNGFATGVGIGPSAMGAASTTSIATSSANITVSGNNFQASGGGYLAAPGVCCATNGTSSSVDTVAITSNQITSSAQAPACLFWGDYNSPVQNFNCSQNVITGCSDDFIAFAVGNLSITSNTAQYFYDSFFGGVACYGNLTCSGNTISNPVYSYPSSFYTQAPPPAIALIDYTESNTYAFAGTQPPLGKLNIQNNGESGAKGFTNLIFTVGVNPPVPPDSSGTTTWVISGNTSQSMLPNQIN